MRCFLLLSLIIAANFAHANSGGDYVVVFHGIARSSSQMEPLAKYLEEKGYDVINIDYPSTDYKLEKLVEIVDKKMSETLIEDKTVHFIGYSMGGLLVRAILNKKRPKKLGRVIQLASPNEGSEVADFLKDNYLYKKIFGPAGQQLTTKNTDTKQILGDVNYELGIIAGNATIDPISSYIIEGEDDGKVSIMNTKVTSMKDYIVVSASHTFLPSNEDVWEQVLYFLKNGEFYKR